MPLAEEFENGLQVSNCIKLHAVVLFQSESYGVSTALTRFFKHKMSSLVVSLLAKSCRIWFIMGHVHCHSYSYIIDIIFVIHLSPSLLEGGKSMTLRCFRRKIRLHSAARGKRITIFKPIIICPRMMLWKVKHNE